MSSCREMEDRLNERADGLLRPGERREVEEHLDGCPGCRETLDGLEALRREAGALPLDMDPPRDLWPGIERRLGAGGTRARRGPLAWRVAIPALAAGLLVVLTAWVTLRIVGPGSGTPVLPGPTLPAAGPGLDGFRSAEVEYRRAADDLLRILEERRDELSPGTVAVVEENLRIINQAIHDAWAALERDPARTENGHLVTSLHRRKIELLQRVVQLPAAS